MSGRPIWGAGEFTGGVEFLNVFMMSRARQGRHSALAEPVAHDVNGRVGRRLSVGGGPVKFLAHFLLGLAPQSRYEFCPPTTFLATSFAACVAIVCLSWRRLAGGWDLPTVDAADYTVWRNNSGASVTASGAALATQVEAPEPTGLSMLTIPIFCLVSRRNRMRKLSR